MGETWNYLLLFKINGSKFLWVFSIPMSIQYIIMFWSLNYNGKIWFNRLLIQINGWYFWVRQSVYIIAYCSSVWLLCSVFPFISFVVLTLTLKSFATYGYCHFCCHKKRGPSFYTFWLSNNPGVTIWTSCRPELIISYIKWMQKVLWWYKFLSTVTTFILSGAYTAICFLSLYYRR